MIETLNRSDTNKKTNIALEISRYRTKGYVVIGIGYPFFYNEYIYLIESCDFFVDDYMDVNIKGWEKKFKIKDYRTIDVNLNYIIVFFSPNRKSVFEKTTKLLPHAKILNVYDEVKIISSLSDIECSSQLMYKAITNNSIKIKNAITVYGDCKIINYCKHTIDISYISMKSNAIIKSRSRYDNIYDAFYLRENASYNVYLDGKSYIRNCYLGKSSQLNVYSGDLHIEDCYIGDNCKIHVYKQLIIGSNTIISWNVSIMDGDGHSLIYGDKNNTPMSIIIGNNVWIGNNAIILKGVNIGDNSVIAAGSVVTQSVPSCSLVAGNPAKIIRQGIDWNYKYMVNMR